MPAPTVYTSCGFQSSLQVQSSLAMAVMADSEVITKTRTLHTLNVVNNAKKINQFDNNQEIRIFAI